MKIFDARAMLADLDSPEAEAMHGSVIVTAAPAEILADLSDVFVRLN